jgi:protein TonB
VHGRLKPSNIMVVDDQLKLSAENIRGATPIAPIPPTLDIYDAPERAAGKISPASDLWSLGVTLVESLTRIPPAWNRASTVDPMVPPSVVSPFAQIARECLRQEPNLRCSLDEVHACLASGAAVPHRAGPAEKRTATARRRILVAAASVALLALFGAFMLRWHHANSTTASALSAPSPTGEAPTATTPDSSAPPAASSTPNDSTQSGSTPPANTPAPSQPSPASQAPAQQTSAPVQPQPGAANPSPDSTPAPPPAAVTQPAPSAHSGTAKGGVAQQVMPEVPEKAIRTIEGTLKVGIQVNVDPSGAVSEATIASQGPSLYFANLALKAAQNWKFKPAIADGQPVPSVWRLRFEFHRSGTDVIPLEQNP